MNGVPVKELQQGKRVASGILVDQDNEDTALSTKRTDRMMDASKDRLRQIDQAIVKWAPKDPPKLMARFSETEDKENVDISVNVSYCAKGQRREKMRVNLKRLSRTHAEIGNILDSDTYADIKRDVERKRLAGLGKDKNTADKERAVIRQRASASMMLHTVVKAFSTKIGGCIKEMKATASLKIKARLVLGAQKLTRAYSLHVIRNGLRRLRKPVPEKRREIGSRKRSAVPEENGRSVPGGITVGKGRLSLRRRASVGSGAVKRPTNSGAFLRITKAPNYLRATKCSSHKLMM